MNQIDLSQLSAKELQEELQKREQAQQDKIKVAREAYLKDKDNFLKHTISKFQSYKKS